MKEIKVKNKNFFTKILIKFCRTLGFEIIDQSDFEVSTLNKKLNESLSIPGKKSLTIPLGEVQITRKVKSLDIILRTCMNINMLTQSKKRIFEKKKEVYTEKTLRSLTKSIKYAKEKFKETKFKIYIIDHNSEKEQLTLLENILRKSNIDFEIQELKIDKFSKNIKKINEENKEVSANQKSNMSNIHQSLVLSKERCEDLTYFVEDDYLHDLESISETLFTYEKISSLIKNELIICTTDYPYLYKNIYDTKIFLGERRHWRQIDQTLCSFIMSKEVINKYFKELVSMCEYEHYPFEKPLHNIYKKELCISPIPSLSVHFTNINSAYGLSPNVDWEKLWDSNEG